MTDKQIEKASQEYADSFIGSTERKFRKSAFADGVRFALTHQWISVDERLQDISDEDCIKEGVIESVVMGTNGSLSEYFVEGQKHICYGKTPREAYAVLIDRISGKGTWDKNPYVFVYDFELVD